MDKTDVSVHYRNFMKHAFDGKDLITLDMEAWTRQYVGTVSAYARATKDTATTVDGLISPYGCSTLITKTEKEIMDHECLPENYHRQETNTLVGTTDIMSIAPKTSLDLIEDDACYETTSNTGLQDICDKLGKYYKRLYKKDIAGFNYYCYANTKRFVCFLSRKLLMQVHNKNFVFYGNKYADHHSLKLKYLTYGDCKIMLVYEREVFKAQFGFGFLKNIYASITQPIMLLSDAKEKLSTLVGTASKCLIIDVLALLLNLRDGFLTPTKVASLLMSLYTLHIRYMHIYHGKDVDVSILPRIPKRTAETMNAQAGASLTDLLIGFTALGLPTKILDAIRTFTTLTGKRIFESDVFMETAHSFFTAIITVIEWIAEPFVGFVIIPANYRDSMIGLVRKVGSSVFLHAEIKNICDIYTKYISNPQCLFDPTFRQSIMSTHSKLIKDPLFMDYIANGNNKYFQTTWNLFEANVVKSCNAFDTSGREEPICFIFEGEAGSGKSTLMNAFVTLLKESGMTTICHSVPAAEDGKDFYDDYENQEVFVMDDVGQQGKSQWRYIINYVSPVKYPLPCATASKKNTKFFNSKIIIATTNHFTDLGGFTSSDCITEPEALFRRAHVINVSRGKSDHFSQVIKYMKYDHIESKRWENKFLHHNAIKVPAGLTTEFSTENEPDVGSVNALTWLYRVYRHIVKTNAINTSQTAVKTDDLRRIIDAIDSETDNYQDTFDGQSFNLVNFLKNNLFSVKNHIVDYSIIFREFVSFYVGMISDSIKDYTQMLVNGIMSLIPSLSLNASELWETMKFQALFVGMLGTIFLGLVYMCFTTEDEEYSPPQLGPLFIASNIHRNEDGTYSREIFFGPQAGEKEKEYTEWIAHVRRGCKTIVVKGLNGEEDTYSQCVVSGKRLLLPAHMQIGDRFVDLYQTWQHYVDKHVEIENVQLRLVRRYFTSDLAIYEIKGTVPLYPLNKQLFKRNGCTDSRNWFLINSSGSEPVYFDYDVKRNNERVSYSTVAGKFDHSIDSGFYTPFSANGACGTVLAAPGVGILGFHVAGGSSLGFCVQPSQQVEDEINALMLDCSYAIGFELDDKVIPNFSGVRVRYERPVQQVYIGGETTLEHSVLHVDQCPEMLALIHEVETSKDEFTTVPIEPIDRKAPPNFRAAGNPAKTLKKLSQKTFMRQGRITPDEVEFMKKYVRSLMVQFTDLSDEVTAFGSDEIPALNKDSSNGYNCKKKKTDYFDFETKEIKQEMRDLAERIREKAEKGIYDYDDFMCRETFKDELRKSTKVDSPRTFRVMPLGHIWWTKKIFGQLLVHFKKTRMSTGISVGFNPYLDGDRLAKKLLKCIKKGDADFGKWDGTVLAAIIRLIMEVAAESYTGSFPYMIEWLINTIANSFVLVNDEIWATTHGLPSGTWLTLLLNCLINKCLTALVVYRNKPNATVEDIHAIIDFVTGDDKVFGVDEDMAPYFDLLKVKEVTESLGMDCTNGDKTPITRDTQEFDKLTYVKRHFRRHPVLKRYIGCLSLDTIFNTLQWIRTDTEDKHEAMMGKMRSMQVESYIHSPALFHELTKIFENKYPFEAFFDEKKVLKILDSPEGYEQMMNLQGKFTWAS